jgi:hypothetical protein
LKICCRWSELPGGSLVEVYITEEVVKVDTPREWAVSSQPPMHTARCSHAAVYHSQYLYVLGGWDDSSLSECERFVCAESRWEVLPALPVAYQAMSAVELDNSLYALGGNVRDCDLDTVQQLCLHSLTWELMQLKLPQSAHCFPCFKSDTEVYLVIEMTLYSFTPLEIKPIKSVPAGISWCDASYYSRGSLYYSWSDGIGCLAVGELTNL